jgi:hypothetical protein
MGVPQFGRIAGITQNRHGSPNRKGRSTMFVRTTFVMACVFATTTTASAEFLWGVNGHPITAYPGITIERQLDLLKELGTKSYRVNISDVEGADVLATLVKEGNARGIAILPVITPGGLDLEKDSSQDLYNKAYRLSVTLGTRFKDDIRVWELGNEMENEAIIKPCETRDDGTKYPCEWGVAGGTSALDYYGPRWVKVSAVLKGLSDGMTKVDPEIRKAIGTAGWGHVGAFDRMKKDGIDWDISVWHMYGEDPEWAFRKLASYNRPIWVTEFNHPKGSESGDRPQVSGLRQAMLRLQELQPKYNVEAAHIYELLDEPYWGLSFEASMGLVRMISTPDKTWITGEPKPAYVMVREFLRGPQSLPRPQRDCDLADTQSVPVITVRQARFAHCLILERNGNAQEVERWSTALDYGETTAVDILLAMLRSEEFQARYPVFAMTDRAYVNFLYVLLLERHADTYGLDTYVKQLASGSMTRENVAAGLILSSEFQARHGARLGINKDTQASTAVSPADPG